MHITNVQAKDHNLKERKLLKSYIYFYICKFKFYCFLTLHYTCIHVNESVLTNKIPNRVYPVDALGYSRRGFIINRITPAGVIR